MTEQTTTEIRYPAWQQAARHAQGLELARRETEAETTRRQREKEHAAGLEVFKLALAGLGIEAEPTSLYLELDGYIFTLESHKSDNVTAQHFYAAISVEKPTPKEWAEAQISAWPCKVAIGWVGKNHDWLPDQLALAVALDTADERFEECRVAFERLMASPPNKAAESVSNTEPTLGEQLEALMRRIATEVYDERDGY
jgi:hypothetical protein